jgi:hypothetical protein
MENKRMEKLYDFNSKLAKIWKLGKLQILVYPMIGFALLAAAIILIALFQYIEPYPDTLDNAITFVKSLIIR